LVFYLKKKIIYKPHRKKKYVACMKRRISAPGKKVSIVRWSRRK
jgi:hypothetical protein